MAKFQYIRKKIQR